jgi:hypothetical protein
MNKHQWLICQRVVLCTLPSFCKNKRELAVALLIMDATLSWHKITEKLTIQEFATGSWRRFRNGGTGLPKWTLYRAIGDLTRRGIVGAVAWEDGATYYYINAPEMVGEYLRVAATDELSGDYYLAVCAVYDWLRKEFRALRLKPNTIVRGDSGNHRRTRRKDSRSHAAPTGKREESNKVVPLKGCRMDS